MGDHRRDAVPAGAACLTARAQIQQAQLTHERHIGAVEPELTDLAEQDGPVDVHVIGEPRAQIVAEGLEAARLGLPGGAHRLQILPNSLPVAAGVPDDRRHRPAAARKRVNLEIVLLCEHPAGASLRVAGISDPRP